MPDQPAVLYETRGQKAYITLNRPQKLNALTLTMAEEISAAVARANASADVRVIVLQGAGRSFSSGYDLSLYAEEGAHHQGVSWDPIKDYASMRSATEHYFSLWRSLKPTIAAVQGHAIAGGSDVALSCDLVVMADDAQIGYMPARIWGCPTTAMWVYRLGAERAKRMLLTGDTITGTQAAEWGLVLESVPENRLTERVEELADRMATVPSNQLAMQKLMVNQAYDNMGLQTTQNIASLFDGIARHSPEGQWFMEFAQTHGFHAATAWRDKGGFIPDGGGPIPSAADIADL